MAAWKLLGPSVFLGLSSTLLLSIALLTDNWYIIDASLYNQVCTENNVLADFYPWPIPFYGPKSDKRTADLKLRTKPKPKHEKQQNDDSKPYNFDLLLSSSVILPVTQPATLPAPLLNENKQAKFTDRHLSRHRKKNKINDHLYRLERKYGLGFSRTTRTVGKVKAQPKHISISIRQPRKEMILNWFSLMKDLNRNLRSFGARDITQRRYGKQRNFTLFQDKTKQACSLRQFSTVTGLFRTCYLPRKNSFLQKSIDCGNLTKCLPISYMGVDYLSFPVYLSSNETKLINGDEKNFLDLRRAMISFLFLALGIGVFGVLVTSFGWYRNVGFEQNAGGLVQLMSGIFHLAGMCAHILWCRSETNRQPRNIYTFPPLLLQSYGASCCIAWIALVFTLLSSFLCIKAAFSKPKPRSKLQTYDSICQPYIENEANNAAEQASTVPSKNYIDPPPLVGENLEPLTTPMHCDKPEVKKDNKTESNQQFKIRTPAAAIRALQEERNEILQLMTQTLGTPRHSLKEQSVGKRTPLRHVTAAHSFSRTNFRPSDIPSSSQHAREVYKRRTKSLPRDTDSDKSELPEVTQAIGNSRNLYRNNTQPKAPYSATLSRLDNVIKRYSNERNEANQVKIAELFRSTSLAKTQQIDNNTSDQNDECYSTASS